MLSWIIKHGSSSCSEQSLTFFLLHDNHQLSGTVIISFGNTAAAIASGRLIWWMYTGVSDLPVSMWIHHNRYNSLEYPGFGGRRHSVTCMGQTVLLLTEPIGIAAPNSSIADNSLLFRNYWSVQSKAAGHIFGWCKLTRCPSRDVYDYKFVGRMILYGLLWSSNSINDIFDIAT